KHLSGRDATVLSQVEESEMRLWKVTAMFCAATAIMAAQDLSGEVWQFETRGDAAQAQQRLQKAAEAAPADPVPLRASAEFLARHRVPSARQVYEKLSRALANRKAPAAERAAVAKRLAILDLVAGDQASATKHLAEYNAAGGNGLTLHQASKNEIAEAT